MPPKLLERVGKQLIELIGTSGADADGYSPPEPPDETQKALLKALLAQVAECAKDLDIAAETVASKRELSAVLVSGSRDSRVFTGWRRELIGEALLQSL
jgi:ribonuclease D